MTKAEKKGFLDRLITEMEAQLSTDSYQKLVMNSLPANIPLEEKIRLLQKVRDSL